MQNQRYIIFICDISLWNAN